jgi:hypothetical protein
MNAITAASPKAAGLNRFIPSAEVMAALSLIIAALAYVNDLVFDWAISNSGALSTGTNETNRQTKGPSAWIKISSLSVPTVVDGGAAATYDPKEGRSTAVRGRWGGGKNARFLHRVDYDPRRKTISPAFVSGNPGEWHTDIRYTRSHPPDDFVFVLYAWGSAYESPVFSGGSLNLRAASEMAVLPFRLKRYTSKSSKIRLIAVDAFIDWYNSNLEWIAKDRANGAIAHGCGDGPGTNVVARGSDF